MDNVLLCLAIGALAAALVMTCAFFILRAHRMKKEREAEIRVNVDEIMFGDDIYAASVFFMINDERVRRHLEPLEFDFDLAAEALTDLKNYKRDRRDPYFLAIEREFDSVADEAEACYYYWRGHPFYMDLWEKETEKIGVVSYVERFENEEGPSVYRYYLAKIH